MSNNSCRRSPRINACYGVVLLCTAILQSCGTHWRTSDTTHASVDPPPTVVEQYSQLAPDDAIVQNWGSVYVRLVGVRCLHDVLVVDLCLSSRDAAAVQDLAFRADLLNKAGRGLELITFSDKQVSPTNSRGMLYTGVPGIALADWNGHTRRVVTLVAGRYRADNPSAIRAKLQAIEWPAGSNSALKVVLDTKTHTFALR